MKILHQKAGPEETVGLTKEDREHQASLYSSEQLLTSLSGSYNPQQRDHCYRGDC